MKPFIQKFNLVSAAVWAWTKRTSIAATRVAIRLGRRAIRSRVARVGGRVALRSARVAVLTAILLALTVATGWFAFHRVAPGTIGVKQINFGGGGIVAEDYPSGLHFGLRGYHSWHEVDGRTQLISFGWNSEPADAEHLKVRTADGNFVRIGVAVPFKLKRGEAHRLVEDGLKSTYRQRVLTTVEKVLTTELSHLQTEEFWDTDRREACLAAALPRLNADLAPLHVTAEAILVELFRFNPEYEKRQQQVQLDALKAVVDQTTASIHAEQEAIDQTLRDIERDETDLTIELRREIDRENDAGKREIEATLAEARYYDQTRKAEADAGFTLSIASGERDVAEVEQMRTAAENESYSSTGGKLLLARAAAEHLNIQRVVLNSNDPRNPSVLDLDELVKLLIGGTKRD